MDVNKEIEKHRIPCGAMTVSVQGVCRRSLRDHLDSLMDRLTREIHPEGRDSEQEFDDSDIDEFEDEETRDERKERLIEEGKLRAEVSKEVRKYKEKLMGNSKMLQNPSGKLPKK